VPQCPIASDANAYPVMIIAAATTAMGCARLCLVHRLVSVFFLVSVILIPFPFSFSDLTVSLSLSLSLSLSPSVLVMTFT